MNTKRIYAVQLEFPFKIVVFKGNIKHVRGWLYDIKLIENNKVYLYPDRCNTSYNNSIFTFRISSKNDFISYFISNNKDKVLEFRINIINMHLKDLKSNIIKSKEGLATTKRNYKKALKELKYS